MDTMRIFAVYVKTYSKNILTGEFEFMGMHRCVVKRVNAVDEASALVAFGIDYPYEEVHCVVMEGEYNFPRQSVTEQAYQKWIGATGTGNKSAPEKTDAWWKEVINRMLAQR